MLLTYHNLSIMSNNNSQYVLYPQKHGRHMAHVYADNIGKYTTVPNHTPSIKMSEPPMQYAKNPPCMKGSKNGRQNSFFTRKLVYNSVFIMLFMSYRFGTRRVRKDLAFLLVFPHPNVSFKKAGR